MNEQPVRFFELTETDVITIQNIKNTLIKRQMYEDASLLRDIEKRLIKITEQSKNDEKDTFNPDVKIYSKKDVDRLITLANAPLKEGFASYEKRLKELVDNTLSEFITEFHDKEHKLKEEFKDEINDFAEFILKNFGVHHFMVDKDVTNYKPKFFIRKDVDQWSDEPTKGYGTGEVYQMYLDQKPKPPEPEVIKDEKPLETPCPRPSPWTYNGPPPFST